MSDDPKLPENDRPILQYHRPTNVVQEDKGVQVLAGIATVFITALVVVVGANMAMHLAESLFGAGVSSFNAMLFGSLSAFLFMCLLVALVVRRTGWRTYLPAILITVSIVFLVPVCGILVLCGPMIFRYPS